MTLTIAQIVLAVLLMAGILVQQRGSGLSGAFGGESNVYSTRRGAEKFIFVSTIVITVLFLVVSLLRIIL
jgi:protein translocase SecG subunit